MFYMSFPRDVVSNIKSFFKTTMDTLDIVQAQTEKIIDMFYSSGVEAQKEYIKLFKEWLKRSKEMRDNLRRTTEEYLNSFEELVEKEKA